MQGGGHCQHATGSNYAKAVLPFDKDKTEVKGKSRTRLYIVGAALPLYTGLLLLLQSDIVVPSAHMMNESPCIGQAGSYGLCNKQKKKGFFKLFSAQAHLTLPSQ